MHKQSIRTIVKEENRVVRWEHLKPLECSCCKEPALYRIYTPDSNSHIGARMWHLCARHFTELCKGHDVLPVKIDIKEDKELYPLVKCSLGAVVRDTDPDAMTTDQWVEHLAAKRGRGSSQPRSKTVTTKGPVTMAAPSASIMSMVKRKAPTTS